jgi:predicted nucleic acid-binding protein
VITYLDTDVLINYLRGRAEAVAYLESLSDPLVISAMTAGDLRWRA